MNTRAASCAPPVLTGFRHRRARWVAAAALLALITAGCQLRDTEAVSLVPAGRRWQGVVFRSFSAWGSRVCLVDVDLRTPGVALAILPRRPTNRGGVLYGPARSLP